MFDQKKKSVSADFFYYIRLLTLIYRKLVSRYSSVSNGFTFASVLLIIVT